MIVHWWRVSWMRGERFEERERDRLLLDDRLELLVDLRLVLRPLDRLRELLVELLLRAMTP